MKQFSSIGVLLFGIACGGAPTPDAPEAPQGSAPPEVAEAAPGAPETPPTSDRPESHFSFVVPEAGATRTEDEHTLLELTIQVVVGNQKHEQTTREEKVERTRTTALASGPKALTKKRVQYEKSVKTKAEGPKESTKQSPLTGKTYVVERKGKDVVFTRDDGSPISDVEREALAEENKRFGERGSFGQFLPDRALKPGEELEMSNDVLATVFGDAQGIKSLGMKFVGMDGESGDRVGVFELRMQIDDVKKGIRTQMDLTGRLRIRPDTAWPVSMELSGPVQLSGADPGGARITGSGSMKFVKRASYER